MDCGTKWKEIYKKTKAQIDTLYKGTNRKWDFKEQTIFSQIEAFVARCKELIEIADGQLQFAIKGHNI